MTQTYSRIVATEDYDPEIVYDEDGSHCGGRVVTTQEDFEQRVRDAIDSEITDGTITVDYDVGLIDLLALADGADHARFVIIRLTDDAPVPLDTPYDPDAGLWWLDPAWTQRGRLVLGLTEDEPNVELVFGTDYDLGATENPEDVFAVDAPINWYADSPFDGPYNRLRLLDGGAYAGDDLEYRDWEVVSFRPILAPGDIIYGDADGNPARLTRGPEGSVLATLGDSIQWETPVPPLTTESSDVDSLGLTPRFDSVDPIDGDFSGELPNGAYDVSEVVPFTVQFALVIPEDADPDSYIGIRTTGSMSLDLSDPTHYTSVLLVVKDDGTFDIALDNDGAQTIQGNLPLGHRVVFEWAAVLGGTPASPSAHVSVGIPATGDFVTGIPVDAKYRATVELDNSAGIGLYYGWSGGGAE